MSVYVDKLRSWGMAADASVPQCFRGQRSCHLYADDERELLSMARRLNLRPEWIQRKAGLVHFDLTEHKRRLAVRYGVIESNDQHMVGYMRAGRMR